MAHRNKDGAPDPPEMKGWLHKWTNYIRGYQKRWFVLSGGFLSYYRSYAEMLHTCRGTISLRGATISTEDSRNFVISNAGSQVSPGPAVSSRQGKGYIRIGCRGGCVGARNAQMRRRRPCLKTAHRVQFIANLCLPTSDTRSNLPV